MDEEIHFLNELLVSLLQAKFNVDKALRRGNNDKLGAAGDAFGFMYEAGTGTSELDASIKKVENRIAELKGRQKNKNTPVSKSRSSKSSSSSSSAAAVQKIIFEPPKNKVDELLAGISFNEIKYPQSPDGWKGVLYYRSDIQNNKDLGNLQAALISHRGSAHTMKFVTFMLLIEVWNEMMTFQEASKDRHREHAELLSELKWDNYVLMKSIYAAICYGLHLDTFDVEVTTSEMHNPNTVTKYNALAKLVDPNAIIMKCAHSVFVAMFKHLDSKDLVKHMPHQVYLRYKDSGSSASEDQSKRQRTQEDGSGSLSDTALGMFLQKLKI